MCGLASLLPLLFVAFASGAVLADRGWLDLATSFGLGLVALLAGLRVSIPRWRAACAAAVFVAAGSVALGVRLEQSLGWADIARVDATIDAQVCGGAERRDWISLELCDAYAVQRGALGRLSVPARLTWTTRRGRPEFDWVAARLPGERIRARLRLRPLAELRNPGERAYWRGLARRGVGGRVALADPLLLARMPERDRTGPIRLIAQGMKRLRTRIVDRLEGAGPGGALLAALAAGERRGLAEPERDAFAVLGVGHLLAVSGLHLAMAAGLAFGLARWALVRFVAPRGARDIRPLALALAVLFAAFYGLLAGWGIPVRRSLVLLVALAVALAGGRVFSARHALAAAGLAIAVAEPWALFEAGAQLSFAASAALLLAARQTSQAGGARTLRRTDGDGGPLAARARAVLAAWGAVIRTTATAFLATAPIAVAHGGMASPVALAANALMVPWTGLVLLPLSLASAAVATLPDGEMARAALELAAGVSEWTLTGLRWVADCVPPARPTAPPRVWALWLAGGLALFALACRSLAVRVGLALLLALWFRVAPVAQLSPDPPRVVVLDVGLGDAVLVQGERAAILVDGGWASRDGDLGASVVVPALRALGVASLDLVIATHGDTDHQGGLQAVLRELPVAKLWLPPGGLGDPVFAALLSQASLAGVAAAERSAGEAPVDLGDLHIETLWPPRSHQGSANDRSLVLRIELADQRLLLTGDLGGEAERALLESGVDLKSDIVKIGHHGSRSSASADFLRRVGASVALLSAPCGRRALPSSETLGRLRQANQAIWWTGRDGALFLKLGGELVVWGWAERAKSGCAKP